MGKSRNETETYSRNIGLDMLIEYDGSGRQLYICMAYPSALTSEAKWQIFKLSYDANGRIVKRRYASGNDNFDKIADNYASYDYTDI